MLIDENMGIYHGEEFVSDQIKEWKKKKRKCANPPSLKLNNLAVGLIPIPPASHQINRMNEQ